MTLILSWHPTFAFFRAPGESGAFELDLNRFARSIKNQLRRGPKKLNTNPTPADIKRIVKGGWVSVDIETKPMRHGEEWRFTGKQPLRAKLKTIGVGNEEEGASIVFGAVSGSGAMREIRKLLLDTRVTKVFHNGYWFDIPCLAKHGVKVLGPIEDTRDARRALSSTSRLKLGYLATLYDDPGPWKEDEEDDEKGMVFTDNLEDLKRYNAEDTVRTSRVKTGIWAEPDWNSSQVQKLYQVQKRISQIAAEMHATGIYVDKARRKKLTDEMLADFEVKSKKFLEAVNIPGMRCNPNDLRSLIYKRHETTKIHRFGLADPFNKAMWSKSATKPTISVKADALLLLLVDPNCPPELARLLDLYWDAAQVWKARSTFVVSGLIDQAIYADGRIHPNWNSAGTETMRWSCSGPNMMNIKEKLRSMYRAPPGWLWVHADKSQLEIRVMHAVSKDPVLGTAIKSGDVYAFGALSTFANQLAGLGIHNVDDFYEVVDGKRKVKKICSGPRKGQKITHLGSQYGASTPTVYKQALKQDRGLRYEQIAKMHNAWKQTYAGTVAYWHAELARVQECGYSEGRVLGGRNVYPAEPELSKVANYPIQRTAGEIMNIEMVYLDEVLKKAVPQARIIEQLHDAIGVIVPEKQAEKVKQIFEEIPVKYEIDGGTYDLPYEIKVGTYWDEL